MNKKAQSRNDNAAWGYLLIFCFAIILLYVLSKFLVILGIISLLAGFGFLIFGMNNEEEQIIFIGIIILVIGFAALILGLAGVNFFENNPVGSDLLKTSQDVVNATAGTYVAVQNAQNEISDAQTETVNHITNSLNDAGGG